MRPSTALVLCAAAVGLTHAHAGHDHVEDTTEPFIGWTKEDLDAKWGTDWGFSGISTFAHLQHERCLQHPEVEYDIAILGVPFDTAVTYRPGARFGPRAIRAASARQTSFRAYNPRAGVNPYLEWAKIIDCGDIPVTPFDNTLALRQMTEAYTNLAHSSPSAANKDSPVKYRRTPKLFTLGGDHSIALPTLRALNKIYGEVAVVHFDAHLDTWHPAKYPSAWVDKDDPFPVSFFTHGTMFWIAHNESLIQKGKSVHGGLRTRLTGIEDNEDDDAQGWLRFTADDIDDLGVATMARRIVEHVGTETPVYLSIDIDVIDPGLAPGTGTPEPGGWTTRELIRVLRGIESLNVVGADVVEVSPSYDGAGEVTALAAAQVAFEVLTSMVKRGMDEGGKAGGAGVVRDEL
ncbi:arginase family-domain-containing protein [Neohortaea acidophila]|uniref:Arginase family-domain-containing protein n=1 Tax=Neohortaea acidophila TaxID=245834 RepID=A0A6A6Q467_9PEZI|nr:arginase family-domain-containing protein [Neohortaea acidophila]KAF2486829.1 arginase family-domain-containing protein [Neohortaea acidophila]